MTSPVESSNAVYAAAPLEVAYGEPKRQLARQLLARHLYILMLLLTDDEYTFDLQDASVPKEVYTRTMIAQWCINVVDFRDADAICTGFEFDINPFDGWNVDGDPATDDSDNNISIDNAEDFQGAAHPDRRLLWGTEYPHLILTEATAFHDYRLIDSTIDNGEGKVRGNEQEDDDDLDQYRVPEGSLFVELLSMGNPSNIVHPRELYGVSNNNEWYLDVGRRSADGVNPVWRLAVSEPHRDDESPRFRALKSNDPKSHFETITFQPDRMDLIRPTNITEFRNNSPDGIPQNDAVRLERFVWFSRRAPGSNEIDSPLARRTYWNRQGSLNEPVPLPVGHYMIAGPRERTVVGSKEVGAIRSPADHRILLFPNAVRTSGGGTTLQFQGDPIQTTYVGAAPHSFNPSGAFGSQIKHAAVVIADIDLPNNDWGGRDSGMNISEPLPVDGYYPLPSHGLGLMVPPGPGFTISDGYGDGIDLTRRLPDTPLDLVPTIPPQRPRPIRKMIADIGLEAIGTSQNVRTIFLQRLADPTLPWNPDPDDPQFGTQFKSSLPLNPYLTIDWLPVDLTIYNGEDEADGDYSGRDGSFISEDVTGTYQDVRFESRERGKRPNAAGSGGEVLNLWKATTEPNLRRSQRQLGESFFPYSLRHTLGYLNEVFYTNQPGSFSYGSSSPNKVANERELGYSDRGAANPWLTWLDRPFVSQYELLQVPISPPGRLTFDHDQKAANLNPYDPDQDEDDKERKSNYNAAFGHLLNFFASSDEPGEAPNFYRVLEYTGVPTRFVGGEEVFNPDVFANLTGPTTRRPPFNTISSYREPGRLNLNTVIETFDDPSGNGMDRSLVYEGLMHGQSGVTRHPGPDWDEFVQSRRGYAPSTGKGTASQVFAMNDRVPTFFAGAFRAADAKGIEDTLILSNDPPGWRPSEGSGADNLILRRESDNAGGVNDSGSGENSLFRDSSPNRTAQFKNVDRNPYFRYQPTQRLANLTTSRSNTFAVWVTVGLFELESLEEADAVRQGYGSLDVALNEPAFRRIYPDGYKLGQELGMDSGDVSRHKGFYIIDRSVPVGFEPGENLNVDDTILLRRRLQ